MTDPSDLRDRAIKSLNAKRGFWSLVVVWVVLTAFFIGIWALTGAGYFWPIWPILGIGIGVAFSAWSAYGPGRGGLTESSIQNEMRKLGS